MENHQANAANETAMNKKERTIFMTVAMCTLAMVVLAIIGFVIMDKDDEILQGQVEATSVRVSGLMPGRVEKFYVTEGQKVQAGDTLVKIYSATVDAKLAQALAMQDAAKAQQQKAEVGARKQVVASAYELWQQAKAALEIRKKTYERLESLFKQNVVSAQKRDEAKAGYDAAKAQESAARSQYEMAKEGAQREDKMAASAMANAASGTVQEVESILKDQYLLAPCDGEVSDIFPHEGELTATGTPIMNILKADSKWIVFNVRETLLENMKMGQDVTVKIPALGMKEVKAKVYFIKDMGEYAVWRATKVTGEFDSKTFEVRLRPDVQDPDMRAGMSAIID